ncbi:MAG: L-threonylcarbamoyladenylate synthase [Desulforhopalus sp.]|nr:L-threonylcarbamoyladenylate synthase [Desulforhopalus sp.]
MAKNSMPDLIGSSLERAVDCFRNGGIVAFPTETYYGLAVDPDSCSAISELYKIKNREAGKPLLLLIAEREQLNDLVERIPPEFIPLMDKFWPGPLTLVFPAKKEVCRQLTGETGTIGVRISSHPLANALAKKIGKPITATSANISGLQPPTKPSEVLRMFGTHLNYIIDGGETPGGLCSTVLGVRQGRCIVLRPGQIDLSGELRE